MSITFAETQKIKKMMLEAFPYQANYGMVKLAHNQTMEPISHPESFILTCEYCGCSFKVTNRFDCPHCGAPFDMLFIRSMPIFRFEETPPRKFLGLCSPPVMTHEEAVRTILGVDYWK